MLDIHKKILCKITSHNVYIINSYNMINIILPEPPPVTIAVFPLRQTKLLTLPTVNFWIIFKTINATTGSDKTKHAKARYFKYTE